MSFRDERLLIFDGSCGVGLQSMDPPAEVWGERYAGCNEYLNLSSPETVIALHRLYLDAGARVIETNTFGGTSIVLAEYGLEGRVAEINRLAVAHARAATAGREAAYVAGSVGPGTKLPSLGHITNAATRAAYLEQIGALVDAGVDALSIETCQDLLQAKIAVVAAFDVLAERGADVPVMLSVTMEPTGTMLVGTGIAAVVATFEPFPLFSLGLNCATGPELMASHVAHLARQWPGRISVMPNAGIPEVLGGAPRYPLTPDDFARWLCDFVERDGVSIVGGCCGTTPEHIRRLVREIEHRGIAPRERSARPAPALSSLYEQVEARQEIPPLLIGERMNANGSRKFKKLLLANDYEGCAGVGVEQERSGAHLLDLCVTFTGRDERADLERLIPLLNKSVRTPLAIDTTNPDSVEAALAAIPGRCLINSINLEDGGRTARRVLELAKRHGAAVIALTIGPDGMAMTAEDKLAVAREIHALAIDEIGLRPGDLFFDALTFTLGAGDPTLADSARQTLAAIPLIKQALPGVHTSLGVSNVSFGLPRASRRYLNSVFLAEALAAGLDAAIVDAGRILPLGAIDEDDRRVCLDLIEGRALDDGRSPLEAFIAHFQEHGGKRDAVDEPGADVPPERLLAEKLIDGDKEGLDDLLAILLGRHDPLGIINRILVPAMRRVGEMFGKGEMLLPFVLQSAEVMKSCVRLLAPLMDRSQETTATSILLATVRGDVHDIGKNLVDIILSNNGYRVINLGTNVPVETIIEQSKRQRVEAIGLSGLLVKSALVMQDSMQRFAEAGLRVPILLGGAALTPRFVAESCVPGHAAPVVYCADAFAGLRAMQELERGELRATVLAPRSEPQQGQPKPRDAEITRDNPVPEPPFLGARHETGIDPTQLYPYLNREALFRGRWGFRRGTATLEEYRALIDGEVIPILEDLKRRAVEDRLVEPAVAYGYFRCRSRGDSLVVEHTGREIVFEFPRQTLPPQLCIADYFKADDAGGDVVGLLAVTLGQRVVDEARALFEADRYRDYLMLHGFAVELVDALAEHWHARMREDLGIGDDRPRDANGRAKQRYKGSRYAFGYPACPDLDAQRPLFELIDPGRIGITLSETAQMVPEVSTSAIVVHHPQAKYFAV